MTPPLSSSPFSRGRIYRPLSVASLDSIPTTNAFNSLTKQPFCAKLTSGGFNAPGVNLDSHTAPHHLLGLMFYVSTGSWMQQVTSPSRKNDILVLIFAFGLWEWRPPHPATSWEWPYNGCLHLFQSASSQAESNNKRYPHNKWNYRANTIRSIIWGIISGHNPNGQPLRCSRNSITV